MWATSLTLAAFSGFLCGINLSKLDRVTKKFRDNDMEAKVNRVHKCLRWTLFVYMLTILAVPENVLPLVQYVLALYFAIVGSRAWEIRKKSIRNNG